MPSGMHSCRELRFPTTHKAQPESNADQGKIAPNFYYAEHVYLGDSLTIRTESGDQVLAKDTPFPLNNGLLLTYGQISALAGDFYGTDLPISDVADKEQQTHRFQAAFDSLALESEHTPQEAKEILDILEEELIAINKAIHSGETPSEAYSKLSSLIDIRLEAATQHRPRYPSYAGLALIDFDHFGKDARIAYDSGHKIAVQYASGEGSKLCLAYAINAFADHFLQDCFSAGHARTPRRLLHGEDKDSCSKFMHDEDSAIGLTVRNPNGDAWEMYGDKRLFDDVSKQNREICLAAVQASADEVYAAWHDKEPPSTFHAWDYAPTYESAFENQLLAPLFTVAAVGNVAVIQRRRDIQHRRRHRFISEWSTEDTLDECLKSGLWDYPIHLDP